MPSTIMCEKAEWHPTVECEDTADLERRRVRRLKSDLFNTHGSELAAPQKQRSAKDTLELSIDTINR